ncbi:MAG: hypothetical protein ACFCU6_02185 [Balneolaceae bacterium]
MQKANQINRIKVKTCEIRDGLDSRDISNAARSISLYYKDGKFLFQGFFTQPLVGRVNSLEGLEKKAEIYFRSIRMIGTGLFHVSLVGKEDKIRKMCKESNFYTLLDRTGATMDKDIRSRSFIDIAENRDHWDVIASVDKEAFYLSNRVQLNDKETHIRNIIVVGDRLLGLNKDRQVVIGQLTPDIIEKPDILLNVEPMKEVNKLGKVHHLETVPNSEDLFLVTIRNTVYQFNIWGDMTHFDVLEDDVDHINSIAFNHTSSIMATNRGLYEVNVQEMPNMVRATSLPRRIAGSNLMGEFQYAGYTEDPQILGIHPAIGVFTKTKENQVYFF